MDIKVVTKVLSVVMFIFAVYHGGIKDEYDKGAYMMAFAIWMHQL